jgi:lantibiotic modifying enzyme
MASGRLYDGLAGIALFLAYTAKLTGDRSQRRLVEGAIRQLRVMAGTLAGFSWGHFTGIAGIGRAMVLIGRLLEDESQVRDGLSYVERACDQDVDPHQLDYFGGCAGVIPILTELGVTFGKSQFLEAARRYGESLLQHTVEQDGATSWPSAYARSRNLVGLADGTSGIICALAKLHALGNDPRLQSTIDKALKYESAAFDSAMANWPDYRQIGEAPAGTHAFHIAWSHGAAGIGFSRLCLLQLLANGDPELRRDLDTALKTTREALLQPLNLEAENFSLGHGRSGCAEFLLAAGEYLNRPELLQTAQDLGRIGIDAYERNGLPWPCGLPEGKEASGLMQGAAGIGYFLLRLHDRSGVPSLLLP